ncbi:MAG: microcompartment protein EutL, partial [Clostridia bacterium]|nr:microcompartment protein EutL [Clostridia bacterium]
MTDDKLFAKVLATRTIANVSEDLAKSLNLPDGFRCIALITADMDDVTYSALDEATKAANVKVCYAKS